MIWAPLPAIDWEPFRVTVVPQATALGALSTAVGAAATCTCRDVGVLWLPEVSRTLRVIVCVPGLSPVKVCNGVSRTIGLPPSTLKT